MCMMRFGDGFPERFILVVDFRSSPGTELDPTDLSTKLLSISFRSVT